MSTEQLDALIVHHIGDLDAASKRLEYVIQPMVAEKINDTVEKWLVAQGWSGKSKWFPEGEVLMTPPQWRGAGAAASTDDDLAFFHLYAAYGDGFAKEKGFDYFWSTRLCKQGEGALGFRFERGKGLEIKKKLWKHLSAEHANKGSARALGFDYEEGDGTFFKPLVIDKEALAKAIEEDDFDEALTPLIDALNALREAVSVFQPLINTAKARERPNKAEFGSYAPSRSRPGTMHEGRAEQGEPRLEFLQEYSADWRRRPFPPAADRSAACRCAPTYSRSRDR